MSRHDDNIETTSQRVNRIERYFRERLDYLKRQPIDDLNRHEEAELQALSAIMFPQSGRGVSRKSNG